jgi:hypothetical protein
MSELIDEDVARVFTKSLVAAEMGFRPSDLASISLVYSTFPKERKVCRWI